MTNAGIAANWQNRSLFHGDNLGFLRAMNSDSVDLIATDPPFNKGRDFHATPDSLAAGAKFQDRWSWERDVHTEWVDLLRDDHPKLEEAIESIRRYHSDGMGAYVCFMAVRLLEMHRVLAPTGCLYLHCDPTASHYLKAVLDAIFGWRRFLNEIVWSYKSGGGSKKHYGRKHDIIFFYSKGSKYTFNPDSVRVPYDAVIAKKRVHLFNPQGKVAGSVWDIPRPPNHSKEWVGWPTQKPLALYERIIKASSNPGDVVLDPFAGCATTLVAAEKLDRQWVGIDIWEEAHDLVRQRLEDVTGLFGQVHFTTTAPQRTDSGEVAAEPFETPERRSIPKEPWQRMSRQDMFDALAQAQSITAGLCLCAGCGRELEAPFMELDHITPRSDRGANDISNRILLCRPCNGRKSANLTLKGLLRENKKIGWLLDPDRAQHARDLAERCSDSIRYGESV